MYPFYFGQNSQERVCLRVTNQTGNASFVLIISFCYLFFFSSIQQHYRRFTGTIRLSKRWVAAQLMADHVTDECIELLVASLFLSPAPFTPPG